MKVSTCARPNLLTHMHHRWCQVRIYLTEITCEVTHSQLTHLPSCIHTDSNKDTCHTQTEALIPNKYMVAFQRSAWFIIKTYSKGILCWASRLDNNLCDQMAPHTTAVTTMYLSLWSKKCLFVTSSRLTSGPGLKWIHNLIWQSPSKLWGDKVHSVLMVMTTVPLYF